MTSQPLKRVKVSHDESTFSMIVYSGFTRPWRGRGVGVFNLRFDLEKGKVYDLPIDCTFADTRSALMEQWGDPFDCFLPNDENWYYRVDGVKLSLEEESSKKAFPFGNNKVSLHLPISFNRKIWQKDTSFEIILLQDPYIENRSNFQYTFADGESEKIFFPVMHFDPYISIAEIKKELDSSKRINFSYAYQTRFHLCISFKGRPLEILLKDDDTILTNEFLRHIFYHAGYEGHTFQIFAFKFKSNNWRRNREKENGEIMYTENSTIRHDHRYDFPWALMSDCSNNDPSFLGQQLYYFRNEEINYVGNNLSNCDPYDRFHKDSIWNNLGIGYPDIMFDTIKEWPRS